VIRDARSVPARNSTSVPQSRSSPSPIAYGMCTDVRMCRSTGSGSRPMIESNGPHMPTSAWDEAAPDEGYDAKADEWRARLDAVAETAGSVETQ
jgi:hypothetical protein